EGRPQLVVARLRGAGAFAVDVRAEALSISSLARYSGRGPAVRAGFAGSIMKTTESQRARVFAAVRPERLLDMAFKLVAAPSRTGEAKPALDCLAAILKAEGLTVDRPTADYPQAPAVAVRWVGKKTGRTMQFNGHLDT